MLTMTTQYRVIYRPAATELHGDGIMWYTKFLTKNVIYLDQSCVTIMQLVIVTFSRADNSNCINSASLTVLLHCTIN